ncbi:hypothetical protein [Aromatoleum petrolei]|uniref:Cytochrome oxidase subunit I profile domain-containing protein n=1 Tax=Aromatoleum petrolei TaxID=76116 RepID=A0ABX1MKJ0_9RHOO|nr:hypothetical protein [Aromatoleum petrolei]NMF88478.1 hypothetical protein [Aromatoleum petrolei]QTQ36946.1 Uncharacterized protein ToN1_28110 [Aromatoleum petrolei]
MPLAPPRPTLVSQRWLLAATMSLGLSSIAAAALVLARTPVLTSFIPPDSFPRALVVHVNLATLLWYFAMASALWTERLGTRRQRVAAALNLGGIAGALGVVTTGLLSPGSPILANYIPYVDHPLFLGSLALFALTTLLTAGMSLTRPRDTAEIGFAIARLPFIMAAAYMLLAFPLKMSLVDALWGAGHILQFGFVTLMMAIWLRLIQRIGADSPPAWLTVALFAAASLPASIAPALLLAGADHDNLHGLHTEIMRWTNWPAPLIFGLLLACQPGARRADGFTASLGLYCVGIVAGTAIESQTTLIPAHYHGTIGAFTLAQMAAVFARLSPAHNAREPATPTRKPLAIYVFGITTLICGLAWSGILGAPRKTAFSSTAAEPGAIIAAALTGLGGVITIIGVAYFALIAAPRIARLCNPRITPTSPHSNSTPAATFAAAR